MRRIYLFLFLLSLAFTLQGAFPSAPVNNGDSYGTMVSDNGEYWKALEIDYYVRRQGGSLNIKPYLTTDKKAEDYHRYYLGYRLSDYPEYRDYQSKGYFEQDGYIFPRLLWGNPGESLCTFMESCALLPNEDYKPQADEPTINPSTGEITFTGSHHTQSLSYRVIVINPLELMQSESLFGLSGVARKEQLSKQSITNLIESTRVVFTQGKPRYEQDGASQKKQLSKQSITVNTHASAIFSVHRQIINGKEIPLRNLLHEGFSVSDYQWKVEGDGASYDAERQSIVIDRPDEYVEITATHKDLDTGIPEQGFKNLLSKFTHWLLSNAHAEVDSSVLGTYKTLIIHRPYSHAFTINQDTNTREFCVISDVVRAGSDVYLGVGELTCRKLNEANVIRKWHYSTAGYIFGEARPYTGGGNAKSIFFWTIDDDNHISITQDLEKAQRWHITPDHKFTTGKIEPYKGPYGLHAIKQATVSTCQNSRRLCTVGEDDEDSESSIYEINVVSDAVTTEYRHSDTYTPKYDKKGNRIDPDLFWTASNVVLEQINVPWAMRNQLFGGVLDTKKIEIMLPFFPHNYEDVPIETRPQAPETIIQLRNAGRGISIQGEAGLVPSIPLLTDYSWNIEFNSSRRYPLLMTKFRRYYRSDGTSYLNVEIDTLDHFGEPISDGESGPRVSIDIEEERFNEGVRPKTMPVMGIVIDFDRDELLVSLSKKPWHIPGAFFVSDDELQTTNKIYRLSVLAEHHGKYGQELLDNLKNSLLMEVVNYQNYPQYGESNIQFYNPILKVTQSTIPKAAQGGREERSAAKVAAVVVVIVIAAVLIFLSTIGSATGNADALSDAVHPDTISVISRPAPILNAPSTRKTNGNTLPNKSVARAWLKVGDNDKQENICDVDQHHHCVNKHDILSEESGHVKYKYAPNASVSYTFGLQCSELNYDSDISSAYSKYTHACITNAPTQFSIAEGGQYVADYSVNDKVLRLQLSDHLKLDDIVIKAEYDNYPIVIERRLAPLTEQHYQCSRYQEDNNREKRDATFDAMYATCYLNKAYLGGVSRILRVSDNLIMDQSCGGVLLTSSVVITAKHCLEINAGGSDVGFRAVATREVPPSPSGEYPLRMFDNMYVLDKGTKRPPAARVADAPPMEDVGIGRIGSPPHQDMEKYPYWDKVNFIGTLRLTEMINEQYPVPGKVLSTREPTHTFLGVNDLPPSYGVDVRELTMDFYPMTKCIEMLYNRNHEYEIPPINPLTFPIADAMALFPYYCGVKEIVLDRDVGMDEITALIKGSSGSSAHIKHKNNNKRYYAGVLSAFLPSKLKRINEKKPTATGSMATAMLAIGAVGGVAASEAILVPDAVAALFGTDIMGGDKKEKHPYRIFLLMAPPDAVKKLAIDSGLMDDGEMLQLFGVYKHTEN
ncbi:MAG: hypothetical protein ABW168_04720 [Sedimenticola sp.]